MIQLFLMICWAMSFLAILALPQEMKKSKITSFKKKALVTIHPNDDIIYYFVGNCYEKMYLLRKLLYIIRSI